MRLIRHVVVAIPARNEEVLLGSCLDSVAEARELLAQTHPWVSVEVAVALDGCTDRTAAVAARYPVITVTCSGVGVGAARDAAVRHALQRPPSTLQPQEVWIANTDADTRVPVAWLSSQVEIADTGADLVLGTVEPSRDIGKSLLTRWRSAHLLQEGHRHIHGANLGVRLTCYRRAGGFGPATAHEDVQMVQRIMATGAVRVATDRARVITSARRTSRVTGGFASYLSALDRGEVTPAADLTQSSPELVP